MRNLRLSLFNNIKNRYKSNETTNFLQELSNSLSKTNTKTREDELYYVLNANPDKIYLTKFGERKVFEATDLPKEIRKVVSEGFILRYKNGRYEIDEELTDKNFEGELDIDNYKEQKIVKKSKNMKN